MIGGTSYKHKFNLINPIDDNLAYRLIFSGTVTHNSNGVQSNGTTGYINTNLVPSTELTQYNTHISFYSLTNINDNSAPADNEIGAEVGVTTNCIHLLIRFNETIYGDMYGVDGAGGRVSASNTNSFGLHQVNKTSSNNLNVFCRGLKLASNTSSTTTTLPNIPLYILAQNLNGTAANFSTKICSFASVGSGFSDTESFYFNQLIDDYQSILSRNPFRS